MKKKFALSLGLVSAISPIFAFAAPVYTGGGSVNDAGGVLATVIGLINYIVPALITIAVIYFIWGVISFITASDEEQKKKGKSKIINGLIGLFVIVSFWGIIAIVKRTFNIGNSTGQNITPCVPTEENGMGADC